MSAIELILRAAKAGITLRRDDEDRLVAKHIGLLSDAWLARLRDNKPDLLAELSLPLVETPPFVLVEDTAALERHLPRLREALRISIDTETSGLNRYVDRLLLIQFALDDRGPVILVDPLKVDVRCLQRMFDRRPTVVMFNASFDLAMLTGAGLDLSLCPMYDVLLAERVVDARGERFPSGYHSLEAVVSRRLRRHLPKSEQLSDWSARPLSDSQLSYAARDSMILLTLADAQQHDIAEGGLQRTVALENAIVHQVAEMERTGVPVDQERWTARAEAAYAEVVRLRAALYAELGAEAPPLIDPESKRRVVKAELWDSPLQLLTLLGERGNAVDSTAEASLIAISADEPLAPLMLDYRKAALRTRTFGLTYLVQHLSESPDGRLHPQFLQLGTQTGRMSCRNPNVQQVPHAAEYRTCFRPSDGVWIKCDYGQVELRLIADRTGDETLIEGFERGIDVHVLTAALLAQKDPEDVTPAERQRAKSVNFGLSYGMGAVRLKEYAWQSYRVGLTLEEAADLRQRYFALYRGIRNWHAEHQTPYGVEVAINTYTPIGRRRRDVTRLTEQLATPIQGAGGDAIKQALELCWQRRAQKPPSARLLLTVHDELCLEASHDDGEAAAAWLQACMEDGLQPLLERVRAVAEPLIAASWAGEPLEAPVVAA